MNDKNFSILTRRDFIRRAACAAVGTVAMTSAIRDLRFMNAAVAQTDITDYKALVCIFLQGGNDSNNLIIPTIHVAIQQLRHHPHAGARHSAKRHPGGHFAEPRWQHLRPASELPGTANAFRRRQAGVSVQYRHAGLSHHPRAISLGGHGQQPPQLFSHADQQTQWQTSIPDQPPTTGWGGRCGGFAELRPAQRADFPDGHARRREHL